MYSMKPFRPAFVIPAITEITANSPQLYHLPLLSDMAVSLLPPCKAQGSPLSHSDTKDGSRLSVLIPLSGQI